MATASGRNPDVLGSFRCLAEKEPRRLIVLCLARDSPVARLAARQPIVDVVEMVPPVPRDGFLATNSLVASVVLLLRAYAQAFGAATGLPRLWTGLLPRRAELRLAKALRPAWDRQTQVVLHGASSRIAALDLEDRQLLVGEVLRTSGDAEVGDGFQGGVQEKVKWGLFRSVKDYSIQNIV